MTIFHFCAVLELSSVTHTCLLPGSSKSYFPLSGAQPGIPIPPPAPQGRGGKCLVPFQDSLPEPETEGSSIATGDRSLPPDGLRAARVGERPRPGMQTLILAKAL